MIRDNSSRAQGALYTFIGLGFLLVGSALFDFIYSFVFSTDTTSTQAVVFETLQGLLVLMNLGLLLLSAVYFILWARRAYYNLGALGVGMDYMDGWVVGAWFVPFIGLYRPYSIMREIWQKTQHLGYGSVTSHGLLRAWWLLFLLRSVVGLLPILAQSAVPSAASIRDGLLVGAFVALFDAAAVLVTVQVIRRITGFEQQMQLQAQVASIGAATVAPANVGATEEEQYL